jgi:hypothetical protein
MGASLPVAFCILHSAFCIAVAAPIRIEVSSGASLADVRDCVRERSPADRSRAVEVILAPGEYVLPEGLDLVSGDGGVSAETPVVWRAASPGSVRIVGARRIPSQSFRKVTDEALLARLPEEGRGRVWAATLENPGGPGIVRAAASSSIAPLPDVFEDAPQPTVFFGNVPGHLAAWPNGDEWATFTERVDRGTPVTFGKNTLWRGGAFIWSHPRAARWDFSEGVWLNGYFTHDWRNCTARVGSYGSENGTNDVMRIAGDIPYGVLAGTWGRKERRFKAVNLFEELDEPLEWWIDRERGVLYLVLLTETADIRVAFSDKPLLRGAGIANLRFEGIVFACNHGPFVSFDSPHGVTFRNCRFMGTASDAIVLKGDARDTTVSDCEIAHCGAGGIRLSGGDRRALTPSGSVIENCRIHDFGIFRRTYAGGVRLEGCGHVLRGCEIWDAPHTAVFWEGNDMLLESNDVHHVLLETGDAGAFYTGRDWTTQGNVLRGNFVHDVGGGTTAAEGADAAVSGTNAMGFYFDDCDCGDEVTDNHFRNVPRAIMIGGGRDHPIRSNVFENCRLAISIDCRGITWGDRWKTPSGGHLLEEKAVTIDYKCGVWAERYPRLARILDDHPGEPLYNPIEGNTFINCGNVLAIGDAFRLDRDGTVPGIVSRLAPIRGNIVRDPPDGPSAHIDPDVAAGFRRIRDSD